jgi:hypothetical protein
MHFLLGRKGWHVSEFLSVAAIAGTLLIGAMPAGAATTSKTAILKHQTGPLAGSMAGQAKLSYGRSKGWFGGAKVLKHQLAEGKYNYVVSFTMQDGTTWTSNVCTLHVGKKLAQASCHGTANMLPGDWGVTNTASIVPVAGGAPKMVGSF